MTSTLFMKAALVWLLIAALAALNGGLREAVLIPSLGHHLALPLSGLILSFIVFLVAYLALPFFGSNTRNAYLCVGTQWVAMTLLFELALGRLVSGKSWPEIFTVFNPLTGDLFTLVLTTSLLSPVFAAKIRGLP